MTSSCKTKMYDIHVSVSTESACIDVAGRSASASTSYKCKSADCSLALINLKHLTVPSYS